jgi:glycolate oxidase FAD binding subunit
MTELEKELANIVDDSHIHPQTPMGAPIDEYGENEWDVDGLKPQAIVMPANVEELSAVLRLANERRWAVGVAGCGSRLAPANIPERLDLIISMLRLHRIIEYEPADLTASVEAGCRLEAFNHRAAAQRQWLPFDPPNADHATLGGLAASDDTGPLRHAFGQPRDYVIGIEVVQADGTVIKAGGRVVKNVTGYDLNKLFVGSFGTLGVITKINFKLRPRPEAEATAIFLSDDQVTLFDAARTIIASELHPSALVVANERVSRRLDLGLANHALLVRLHETGPAIKYQLDRLKVIAHRERMELVEKTEDESRALWPRLGNFHEDCEKYLYLRASVPPADVRETFARFEAQLSDILTEAFVFAQVGTGVIKAEGAFATHDSAATSQVVNTLTVLQEDCRRVGGSLLIERAPVEIKQQMDVWGEVGPTIELMRAIKRQFDPNRILNPGRFVAGI